MKKKYGFGIVGCGVVSKWHINAINLIDDAELIGVFDHNQKSAESFALEHSCKAFSSYEEMLSSDSVDIISICTPSGTHASLSVEAANRGKNVIVEKPMAITGKQMEEITEAVEKNNIQLCVISQQRFADAITMAKNAIDKGELGELVSGDVYMKFFRSQEYYDSSAWRGTWAMDGGGAMMNQGIHGIDLLQYLMGNVRSVMSMCKTLARDIEVEDTSNTLVEFENGAIGVIQASTSTSPGYPRIIQINGTKGMIEITESSVTRWDINGTKYSKEIVTTEGSCGYNDPTALRADSHLLQIEDFVKSLQNGTKPLVDVYEGRKAVEIILCAYESSKQGKKIYLQQ